MTYTCQSPSSCSPTRSPGTPTRPSPNDVVAVDYVAGSADPAPVWFDGYPYMTAADAQEVALSLLAAAQWREKYLRDRG